jgi:hypothetical protein
MEVIAGLVIVSIPFIFPLITGLMAKSLGRKFWLWFWLGLPLPFIACVILLCLPVRRIEKENEFRIN